MNRQTDGYFATSRGFFELLGALSPSPDLIGSEPLNVGKNGLQQATATAHNDYRFSKSLFPWKSLFLTSLFPHPL